MASNLWQKLSQVQHGGRDHQWFGTAFLFHPLHYTSHIPSAPSSHTLKTWVKHPRFHSTWAHLILEMKAKLFYPLFTDLYSPTRLAIINHSNVIVRCATNNLFLMVILASTLKKTHSTSTIIESKSFLHACVSEDDRAMLDITILCVTLFLKCLWKCPTTFISLHPTELRLSLNL